MSYVQVGQRRAIAPAVRSGQRRVTLPVPRLSFPGRGSMIPRRRGVSGLGDPACVGSDVCPCPSGTVGGSYVGECASCLDPNNLPEGCDNACDFENVACHPELHGSYELPDETAPCSGGTTGWVLPTGSGVPPTWCGPGAQPSAYPAWWSPTTGLFPTTVPPPASTPAGTPVQTPTAGSSGIASPTAVTLANTSRPGQQFQVGDSFKIVITGTPNSAVTDTAQQNGQSLGTTPYGSTDSTGQLTITGTMDTSTLGTWFETWQVGSGASASLNFSVAAVPGSQATSSSPAAGSSSSAALTTPAATGIDLSFLTSTALGVPVWAWIAGAVVAVPLLSSLGGRR